ncbi:Uncharacterised protein [Serratia fonticola]|nr:Uncharacterised protein [Serratia fonticola]
MPQKGIPKVLLPYFPPVRGGFFYAWNSAPIKTGQHLATPSLLLHVQSDERESIAKHVRFQRATLGAETLTGNFRHLETTCDIDIMLRQ